MGSTNDPRGEAAFSIANVFHIAENDIVVGALLRRVFASTYDEFLNVLYDDLKLVIERMESNPQNYPDESEDATTTRIADMRWGMQYAASHNLQAGGNVDLTIEMPRRRYKWIAEAKKFDSVAGMREGYLQLATRYRPGFGANGMMHGGLIGYLRRKNAAKLMADWRSEYASMSVATDATLQECLRRPALGFISQHDHQDFGLPLRIWHMCVVLTFAPKDKSARTSKRHSSSFDPKH